MTIATDFQYAHGLIIVDKILGLMLKLEPGTTGCKKWITLDGCADIKAIKDFTVAQTGDSSFVNLWKGKPLHQRKKRFTVIEDGSRLLGWMAATDGMVLLQEWETSTGGLYCEHIYSRL